MKNLWSDLEDMLGKASQDAQHWESVCDILIDIFGAKGAILVPTNPNFRGQWMSCSTGLKATLPEYLAGGWHLRDPREKVTSLMLKNGFATDSQVFPDRGKKYDMPFYKEFLCKHNFGMLTAMKILTPNGYWGLMLHFANDVLETTEAQHEEMKRAQELLEKTAKKAYMISHQRIASFAQFFQGTDSEAFILDAHGSQVLRIDSFGNLKTQIGVESLLPVDVSNQFKEEVAALCSSDPTLSLSKAYQFNEGADSISVLVIQIPPRLRHFFMPLKVCAIRTRCSEMVARQHKRLREDFELTQAEISTIELLSTGKTPQIIADLLGLKPSSIRQRLKGIYDKVSVSSQIELVAFYNGL